MSALFTPTDAALLARTLSLAARGGNAVSPNPQVGALLAQGERILSEGWHQRYGGPHAEVNCLAGLAHIPADATLYVSLEPCSHHGQTPPCTELILQRGIGRVVVGCSDPNPRVAGRGLALLRQQGVTVIEAPDPASFRAWIRPFAVRISQGRPYIVLKWAQTADGILGRSAGTRLRITGPEAQHYTHALRARADAVGVGARTWAADAPRLDVRHSPATAAPRSVVFGGGQPSGATSAQVLHVDGALPLRQQLEQLYHAHRIGHLLIEGGADTLTRFLHAGLWDECHILVGPDLAPPDARVPAPVWPEARFESHLLGPDRLFRTFAPES